MREATAEAIQPWVVGPRACPALRPESPVGSEPGQQGSVYNTSLAPEVDDRDLACAQQSGKRLRANRQPPLRFGEGNQLRWRRQLQGEVLLPRRGRCPTASRRRWHTGGFPLQLWSAQPAGDTGLVVPSGLDHDWGDSPKNIC